MPLLITSEPAGELLSVADAKRHLRLLSGDLDDEVTSCIRAARDYCERWTQRTLRGAVARTLKQDAWWCDAIKLPWPPLLSSPALAITYYDEDNASQTLSSANYVIEYSTDGGARVVWATDATIPSLYTRPDAVTIAFSTGYASDTAIPPVALQAMKLAVEMYFKREPEQQQNLERSIKALLGPIDWSGYA